LATVIICYVTKRDEKLKGSQTKVFYEKLFQDVNKFEKDLDVLDFDCEKSKWAPTECKAQLDKTNDKLVIVVPNVRNQMNARAAKKSRKTKKG
jgi:hypothetical protein